MAFQIQGNGGTITDVDGTVFRALKVTLRPTDYSTLGEYAISGLSGTIAAGLAANSEIFQARWTDTTRFALIKTLTCDGISVGTGFTAGFGTVNAFVARSWSGDGSGGTALTITGNNQKLRTSLGTTLFGAIRVVSTAALTAGTKTLDAQPTDQVSLGFSATANIQLVNRFQLLGDFSNNVSHPVVLAQNEGVVCRATVPATGTWQTGFTMEWSEVLAY